jgi:D-sedoheptulose 7-phosphate isomerase
MQKDAMDVVPEFHLVYTALTMKATTCAISQMLTSRYPVLAPLTGRLSDAVVAMCACHARNGLILICGNGGSAADAAHITGELLKGFRHARPPEA